MKLHIDINLPDKVTYGQVLDEIAMQLAWTDADRKTPVSIGDGNVANRIRTGTSWQVTD